MAEVVRLLARQLTCYMRHCGARCSSGGRDGHRFFFRLADDFDYLDDIRVFGEVVEDLPLPDEVLIRAYFESADAQ